MHIIPIISSPNDQCLLGLLFVTVESRYIGCQHLKQSHRYGSVESIGGHPHVGWLKSRKNPHSP